MNDGSGRDNEAARRSRVGIAELEQGPAKVERDAQEGRGPSRRPYHHGNLRRALLDVALEVIAQKGIGALSLREIARRLGVTHAAPYRHFLNKERLMAAIAEEGFNKVNEQMLEAVNRDPPSSPIERLRVLGTAYIRFAIHYPHHYRVMFGFHFPNPRAHPEMFQAGLNALMTVTGAIERCQQFSLIPSGSPIPLAITAWCSVHGFASILIEGFLTHLGLDSKIIEAQADVVIRIVATGLMKTIF